MWLLLLLLILFYKSKRIMQRRSTLFRNHHNRAVMKFRHKEGRLLTRCDTDEKNDFIFMVDEEYVTCKSNQEFEHQCIKAIYTAVSWLSAHVWWRRVRLPLEMNSRQCGYNAMQIWKNWNMRVNTRDTERKLRHSVLTWISLLQDEKYGSCERGEIIRSKYKQKWKDYFSDHVLNHIYVTESKDKEDKNKKGENRAIDEKLFWNKPLFNVQEEGGWEGYDEEDDDDDVTMSVPVLRRQNGIYIKRGEGEESHAQPA